ncbi:TetR/AcrR family transcriptional regulator [Paenibacillus monticola]|uniref:TetR family transcriptional regulator n=1 Tax=Paenibacillus monticola TaxID=2666075 RepID=A0A7X2L330_9BACL|nr:TetR/AcrR family transcriptional regulator [Paenibacillus monticola]MRN53931.1 TetR family transcriptional regulator [Paenibacillus monticola]
MYHISKDKRSIQSSEWIFESLQALSMEMAYEEISITDIVNRAGIGRSTFYRNFDHKDDVLRFKCNQVCVQLKDYLINYQTRHGVAPGPASTKPFLEFWSGNSYLIETITRINRIDILNNSYIEVLQQYYYNHAYLIEGIPAEYVEYVIAANVGSTIGVLVQWIKNKKHESPEDLSKFLLQHYISSSNRPGSVFKPSEPLIPR